MLIDYNLVDLGPKSDALYMTIRRKDFALLDYMLGVGVDVNSQNDGQGTPVLRAAAEGHTEMVRFLVKRGADLTITNEYVYRPYTAARANGHMKTAEYIQSIEPAVTEAEQDALFERYYVPAEMRDYFKTGPLRLEFPEVNC